MAGKDFYSTVGKWLDDLEERNSLVFWFIIAIGIITTIVLWWLRLSMGHPLIRQRATTLQFIIYFLPPFFAAFCLGRLWLRKKQKGEEDMTGVMNSYAYMNNSNREYKFLFMAVIVGVANYMLIFLAK